MSATPPPQLPLYRVTLFYGPDPVDGSPSLVCCVFNVKKRSWKGGIQVAVEVEERQLDRLRREMGFEDWLERVLRARPDPERADYGARARDLFVQAVCAQKLDLALAAGLPQENGRIPPERLAAELDQAVLARPDRITAYILTELDLADP